MTADLWDSGRGDVIDHILGEGGCYWGRVTGRDGEKELVPASENE